MSGPERPAMPTSSAIVELRRRPGGGIVAVPYRRRRPGRAIRLPDGLIAELPTPDQRPEAPEFPDGCLGTAAGGAPATGHHASLGLVSAFLPLEGVFLLPTGDVAAVYGAEAVPIG